MAEIWGAAIAAAAAVGSAAYSANKQKKAAENAAKTQAGAASDANAAQLQIYQQQRTDNEPFRQNALTAQSEYMRLLGLGGSQPGSAPSTGTQSGAIYGNLNGQNTGNLGWVSGPLAYDGGYDPGAAYLAANPDVAADPYFSENPLVHFQRHGRGEGRTWNATPPAAAAPTTPAQTPEQIQQAAFDRFRATPGYQFGLDEGQKQVQSSAAAAGGLFSGKAGKALLKFGNDYADQQGYTPYMNRLASVAGMGQTVNSQNAQAGQNYANQFGANLTNAANARASGLIGAANANSQMWGNIAQAGGWLAGQYANRNQPTQSQQPIANWQNWGY